MKNLLHKFVSCSQRGDNAKSGLLCLKERSYLSIWFIIPQFNKVTKVKMGERTMTSDILASVVEPMSNYVGDSIRTILTRLRQKGNPWAMMLMLNILSTFWGGNDSLVTSLGSARLSFSLSSGTCKVFSFLQATLGIFFRAPDDEKRGIGQCRSIAKKIKINYKTSNGSCPRRRLESWPTNSGSTFLKILL